MDIATLEKTLANFSDSFRSSWGVPVKSGRVDNVPCAGIFIRSGWCMEASGYPMFRRFLWCPRTAAGLHRYQCLIVSSGRDLSRKTLDFRTVLPEGVRYRIIFREDGVVEYGFCRADRSLNFHNTSPDLCLKALEQPVLDRIVSMIPRFMLVSHAPEGAMKNCGAAA